VTERGDQSTPDPAGLSTPDPPGAPASSHVSRWRIAAAVARALATTTVLLALYFLLPLDADTTDASVVVKLGLGVAVFAGMVAWNLRGIVSSDNPGLKAFESLFVAVPLLLVLFAATYFVISSADDSTFSEPLTRAGALYFSVTVFSTVGFGDIHPKTDPTRLLVSAQVILDLVVLGVGVRVIAEAVQRGRSRLAADPRGS